jgi:nickel-dependent lactate racemase
MNTHFASKAAPILSCVSENGVSIRDAQVRDLVAKACPHADYRGKRVLLIVPDSTRTAPVGLLFKAIHDEIGGVTAALDVLVALGTHQPMSEEAICKRLEITTAQHAGPFKHVRFFNHSWLDPKTLRNVGVISADEIRTLSKGLFAMDVPVEINKLVFDYDQIMIIGPVFPHEVVGFSGGNKYLFPGISGPEILNFFHWLGAVVTSPAIIGQKWTPVRAVVDRAASMVSVSKLCFCMVVDGEQCVGAYAGAPETAWDAASELSRQHNVTFKDKPFRSILSCAPLMYDELWTGAKCMYKLEPVLADGGELIIYAPHISEVCVTHKETIEKLGYHCRDYYLKQWDKFKNYPWGVLAHSTHVHGVGTFENGIETPRAHVTLATGISEKMCRQINLGYRDPRSIRVEDYAHREDEGVLLVPHAGEKLFQLKTPPVWAGGRSS